MEKMDRIPQVIDATESLVENVDMRNSLIDRVDVLDKVKKLFLIPEVNMVTAKQVADYYGIHKKVIDTVLARNAEELDGDGVIGQKVDLFLRHHNVCARNLVGKKVLDYGDFEVELPNHGVIRLFPKRAVLRIGMLLRDSEVAKEVRTQLLNAFEHTTEKAKVKELDAEMDIMMRITDAVKAGNIVDMARATAELAEYNDRYKKQVAKLTEEKDDLSVANTVLAKKALTSTPRTVVSMVVRSCAAMKMGGNYAFVWGDLYRRILYQLGLNLKSRWTKSDASSQLDTVKDDEWEDIMAVTFAMGQEYGIDVAKTLRETNAEEYSHLLMRGAVHVC